MYTTRKDSLNSPPKGNTKLGGANIQVVLRPKKQQKQQFDYQT